MDSISVYCDESNHLAHNRSKYMTLGYVSCILSEVRETNVIIRRLKEKHGLDRQYELKWIKVSAAKKAFYEELLDYFFTSPHLQFRCVIADKSSLNFDQFGLSHDDWYYRMYYLLLGKSLVETNTYSIYIDIKDTCSGDKVRKLKEVLNNSYYDFTSTMIHRVQQVHSHEVELMQVTDLLVGAIGYCNNGHDTSLAKLDVVRNIKALTGINLCASTPLCEQKFNLFVWRGR